MSIIYFCVRAYVCVCVYVGDLARVYTYVICIQKRIRHITMSMLPLWLN
jgi:hypothetical protein